MIFKLINRFFRDRKDSRAAFHKLHETDWMSEEERAELSEKMSDLLSETAGPETTESTDRPMRREDPGSNI